MHPRSTLFALCALALVPISDVSAQAPAGSRIFTSSDTPVAIPDGIGPGERGPPIYSDINISDDITIGAISVMVDITHSDTADLFVVLYSPDNASVIQLFVFQPGTDIMTTYTTELDSLIGMQATGRWRLRVEDHHDLATGTINRWSITITPPGINQIPTITTTMFPATSEGVDLATVPAYTIAANDAEGDSISYRLAGTRPGWLGIDSAGKLTGTIPFNDGLNNSARCDDSTAGFTVQVSDDGFVDAARTVSQAYTINIANAVPAGNTAPARIGGSVQLTDGIDQTFQITDFTNDADGDVLTYQLAAVQNLTTFLGPLGLITYTVLDGYTTRNLLYAVCDGHHFTSLTLELLAPIANTAPVISAPPIADFYLVDEFISLVFTALDAENHPVEFALTGDIPVGGTIAPSGTFQWFPGGAGTFTFNITANDGQFRNNIGTYELRLIIEADSTPTFGNNAILDQRYPIDIDIAPQTLPEATGGNGMLRYQIIQPLPIGLRFDAATRTLSGRPILPQSALGYLYVAEDSDTNTIATDAASLAFTIAVFASADINEDGVVRAQDAQILYYVALSQAGTLAEDTLDTLLDELRGTVSISRLRNRARTWLGQNLATGVVPDPDLHDDDTLDQQDARILYYALRFEEELAASPALRRTLLSDLVGPLPDNDEGYRQLLRNAYRLR